MTFFDLRDRDGMEIQMQKRIVELEKANQDLRAEILEFKRAEGMLASNSQQLSEVLESISDGFCILDHNWRLTYVNSQAASYLKLISENLIGRQLWEIYPQLVGTDLEAISVKRCRKGSSKHSRCMQSLKTSGTNSEYSHPKKAF